VRNRRLSREAALSSKTGELPLVVLCGSERTRGRDGRAAAMVIAELTGDYPAYSKIMRG
jgi:hypothetical protein